MHVCIFVFVIMPKRIENGPWLLRSGRAVKVNQGMPVRSLAEDCEILTNRIPIYSATGDLVHSVICSTRGSAPLYSGISSCRKMARISTLNIAEHYCAHRTDEVLQCVIYDSNKRGTRLIGIEYIVSAKIFESLPAEEKKLWHSHNYEVKSGVLTAPGMADGAEKDLMKVLIGAYGKTWHTWQVDRDAKLPMGIPQLMMAFTGDGQAQAKILSERDSLYGSSATKKTARVDIPDVNLDPAADAWQ